MIAGRMIGLGLVALVASVAAFGCSNDDGDGNAEATASAAASTAEATSSAETATASSGGGGGDLAIDACGLVTKAEVEAALGGPVNDGVLSSLTPEFMSCEWEDADGFPAAQIVVLVYPDESAASETFAGDIERNAYEEIPNLGDRAYTSIVFDVTVLAGRVELSVDLVPQTDEQLNNGMQSESIELSKRALGRLP